MCQAQTLTLCPGESVTPCNGPQGDVMLLGPLVLCSHMHPFTSRKTEAQRVQINTIFTLIMAPPWPLWTLRAWRLGHFLFLIFSRRKAIFLSGCNSHAPYEWDSPPWGPQTLPMQWLKAWALEPTWVQIPLLPFTSSVTPLWASSHLICKMGW